MKTDNYAGWMVSTARRLLLSTRFLGRSPVCTAFRDASVSSSIQRIYVINLDRHEERWRMMRRELHHLRDAAGSPLTAMTRRFSAVDARHPPVEPDQRELDTTYSLADQLFVEPSPLLERNDASARLRIGMTRQEIAVARSHIAVWRLVAESDLPYTLVLEDDVYFRWGFARALERAWTVLTSGRELGSSFDILYLSYTEARQGAEKADVHKFVSRVRRGLWQLSGYVLSAGGAQRLLDRLPVRGPVDLWVNHTFAELDVWAAHRSIIEQRPDVPSSNSYSILPVLAKVGVLTHERPSRFAPRPLVGPVFASGEEGSGLTALAMALSMLGYRCCSDVSELPESERELLWAGKPGRVFNAYVNVGEITQQNYATLAAKYPNARFIMSMHGSAEVARAGDVLQERRLLDPAPQPGRMLTLASDYPDKWESLSRWLGCDYPSDAYPTLCDESRRTLIADPKPTIRSFASKALECDTSPWIVSQPDWSGLQMTLHGAQSEAISELQAFLGLPDLDAATWAVRDDTFPSNLALFRPANVSVTEGIARLTLKSERTSVREFTSGAICSRHDYHYGRFTAEVKPAKGAGLITGVFLHRNAPRQEIDIEFLGRDTTKLLVNVYYNPGDLGARMEYGYRGTPVLIDLGFDAAEDFHQYEIEWRPNTIRWKADGVLMYERATWEPTPIPHLPLQVNINLWHSRSEELAGRLVLSHLPAHSEVRSVEVYS